MGGNDVTLLKPNFQLIIENIPQNKTTPKTKKQFVQTNLAWQ